MPDIMIRVETEDYDAYYTESNLTTPDFIQERVREMLPDPVPLTAEEITGSMPAIRE